MLTIKIIMKFFRFKFQFIEFVIGWIGSEFRNLTWRDVCKFFTCKRRQHKTVYQPKNPVRRRRRYENFQIPCHIKQFSFPYKWFSSFNGNSWSVRLYKTGFTVSFIWKPYQLRGFPDANEKFLENSINFFIRQLQEGQLCLFWDLTSSD